MLTRLKHDLTMAEAARHREGARVDLLLVAEMVAPGARVLDVGWGDGELLRLLAENRGVDGRGIELSREGGHDCVPRGSPWFRATRIPICPITPRTLSIT